MHEESACSILEAFFSGTSNKSHEQIKAREAQSEDVAMTPAAREFDETSVLDEIDALASILQPKTDRTGRVDTRIEET